MLKTLSLCLMLLAVSAAAWAANTTITQSHTSFDSDEVTLKAGDTITFVNKDDVTHNIQIVDSSGNNEDKGLQKPNENITATFAQKGEYKIRCAIHPKMKMAVTAQ